MDGKIIIDNPTMLKQDGVIVYGDNRIALIEKLNYEPDNLPVRIDMVVGLVCLNGNATFYVNGNKLHIEAGDLFVCHPNAILSDNEHSDDIDVRCFCMTREYVKHLAMMPRNIWEIILHIEKSPIMHLQQIEINTFTQYYNLLRTKLLSKPSTNRDAIIDSLAQAIIYEIQDAFATVVKIEPVKYTSSNMLFSRFLELLSESAPKEREVTYYADRLFVSPKYLSAVCKEVCGNTASAIIGAYVTKEVERLLKANTMSIKEIANELNFSSISFFGKYVRKRLGMSPKHYRELLARNAGK